jgi:uncharacterized protein (TIGR03435 family)
MSVDTDPAIVRYANISLKNLIAIAYGMDSRLVVGGPSWLDDQPYDVSAKLPPGTQKDRIPGMLQRLLEDRFKLAAHREGKEQRAHFLVLGKGSPNLKRVDTAAEDSQDAQHVNGNSLQGKIVPGGLMIRSVTMPALAAALANVTGYQVVDRTGLTGNFDVNLAWKAEDSQADGPDLFTAIQEQLGLKLESGKTSVDTLVVDHAERTPSEN